MMAIDMRPKEQAEMRKCLCIMSGTIHLTVYAPPEMAIPELEATGAKVHSVSKTKSNGMMWTGHDALKRAKELISNGWEWG